MPLLLMSRYRSIREYELLVKFVFCCVGCWMGAFVIPLDWGRVWQKWPIPLIYSSSVGYFLGLLYCKLFKPVIKE